MLSGRGSHDAYVKHLDRALEMLCFGGRLAACGSTSIAASSSRDDYQHNNLIITLNISIIASIIISSSLHEGVVVVVELFVLGARILLYSVSYSCCCLRIALRRQDLKYSLLLLS